MALSTLSDDKIDAILANPPLFWRVIAAEEPDSYLQEIDQAKPPNLLQRWFGKQRDWPPVVPSFEFAEAEKHEVDVDKSWDGINFCLKQLIQKGVCPNLFEDGKPVGKIEIGYGPAMCFTSKQVAQIADSYGAISADELLAQYRPEKMKGVYLDRFWQRGDDDCRAYLTENFAVLQGFLSFAKQHGLGVIVQYT